MSATDVIQPIRWQVDTLTRHRNMGMSVVLSYDEAKEILLAYESLLDKAWPVFTVTDLRGVA